MFLYFFFSLLFLLLRNTDDFSMVMVILVGLIFLWVTILGSASAYSLASALSLFVFGLTSVFFTTSTLIVFYVCFEGVLFPMFILLLTFGHSFEKVNASVFLLLYTIIGSFPFLLFAIRWFCSVSVLSEISSLPVVYSLFVTFGAKSPLFWLHAWLPKAHTEAPLLGSILLSGVLLKLGGFGIYFLAPSIHICSSLLLLLCLYGSVLCCLVTLRCWDSKLLVAYSSIVHMGAATSGLLCGSSCSTSSALVAMVSHSLVSPVLFWAVSEIYSVHGSRRLLLHFNSSLSSTFIFLFCLLCGLNFGLPPFLGFWGEVFLFLGLGWTSLLLLALALPIPFFVIAYSLVLLLLSVGGKPGAVRYFFSPSWVPLSCVSLSFLASSALSSFSY